jgi:DNA polymerase-3 subunit epsilon
VELGCVEMWSRVRTGKSLQFYFNPERDVPEEAFNVHGLSRQFLSDKPLFHEKIEEILLFLGDSPLVIHNAQFDMAFLNAELARHQFPPIPMDRAIDTVGIARKKFPGAPAKLDALCKRFNIDLSARTKHGALLDAELLADVYLELMGGRQAMLMLAEETEAQAGEAMAPLEARVIAHRVFPPSAEELAAHTAFLAKIKNALWLKEGVA